MTTAKTDLAAPATSSGSRRRWLAWALAALVVAGVFLVILPQMSDMREVWRILRGLSVGTLAITTAVTAWNQATYWLVALAALPGLTLRQAATVNLASTAVANTVPAGGGFGVGVTTTILRSWDFSVADVGRYVVITGIWNNFVKLGMPIVALALLAATGDASGWLLGTAAIGVVILVAAVAGFVGLLRSEDVARWLGEKLQTAATWLAGLVHRDAPSDLTDRAVSFREDAQDLLAKRWTWLTLTTLIGHLSLFGVLLLALRVVGIEADQLSWIQALAGFAFARLLTAVPITPGGAGLIELGYVGVYTQFGADKNAVVAAVLLFRMLTYVLPIPLGAFAWWSWSREQRT